MFHENDVGPVVWLLANSTRSRLSGRRTMILSLVGEYPRGVITMRSSAIASVAMGMDRNRLHQYTHAGAPAAKTSTTTRAAVCVGNSQRNRLLINGRRQTTPKKMGPA